MRTPLVVTAGVVAFALIGAACSPKGPGPLTTPAVTVDARCAGPHATAVTVTPWNLAIKQGDAVDWTINSAANTDAITITPKNPGAWPFETNTPRGTKDAPAHAGGMHAGAAGRYSYTIQLVCQSGSAPPDTVVVDPDVIVD